MAERQEEGGLGRTQNRELEEAGLCVNRVGSSFWREDHVDLALREGRIQLQGMMKAKTWIARGTPGR